MLGDDSAAAEEPSPADTAGPPHASTALLPAKRPREVLPTSVSPRDATKETPETREPPKSSVASSSSHPLLATNTTAKLQKLFSLGTSFDRRRAKALAGETRPDVPLTLRVPSVPLDVTPKSKVVVTTPFPFPFARTSTRSLATALTTGTKSNEHLDPQTRWLRSTQLFVHPASSLPPSLVLSNDKQVEEAEFYVHRFRAWQDAFRAAYLGWRQRSPESLREQSLYLHCSDFIVCFHHVRDGFDSAGDAISLVELCRRHGALDTTSSSSHKSPRLSAVISHSNARLRKDLQRANVRYSTPFNLRAMKQTVTNLHALEDELGSFRVSNSRVTSAEPGVHGPDSLLLFNGHQAVHGLYEFLLNRKPLSNQDVPEIIGFQPFTNATIRSVDVRYLGKVSVASNERDATRDVFRIEISGFATTAIVHDIVTCLQAKSQGDNFNEDTDQSFRVVMETMPLGERLNAVFLDSKGAPQAAGLSSEARTAWKHELELAKRRLQAITIAAASRDNLSSTEAVVGDGDVVVEMTARAS
ncbi:hypothetical protein PINS_up011890 [Pythium insidiosum]|nr:hypothetical protein PINS_up011890 [Pythium insidiosum]